LYEKPGLSFRCSILFFPEDNGLESDAMPVLPSLGIAAGWPVFSFMRIELLLGFDLRTWLPVWRLWDAGSLPAVEGWRFGAGIRFSIL
jgi:hypothetical protein